MIDPSPLQWCEPNTHLKNMCFLVLLGLSDGFRWFQMVSRFREKNVGTRGTSAVQATYGHVTTRVLYVTRSIKCTQSSKIIPYYFDPLLYSKRPHGTSIHSGEAQRADPSISWALSQLLSIFLLVSGKTHCALIAARASNVSNWETWGGKH